MRVFMSYRRQDGISYSLPDLKALIDKRFGVGTAFFDIDDIPIGTDFREHIVKQLDNASIVLVFIGDRWVGEEPDGTRRIDLEGDFVRIEVEMALAKKIPVVPVFTGLATNKILEKLPFSIEGLKYRNGIELRSGPDLIAHREKLIDKLSVLSTNLNSAAESIEQSKSEYPWDHKSNLTAPRLPNSLAAQCNVKSVSPVMKIFPGEKILAITVNKSLQSRGLYDAVRCAWKLSLTKAQEVNFVLAMNKDTCIEVFVPEKWSQATPENFPGIINDRSDENRIGFVGYVAPGDIRARFVGFMLPEHLRRKPGNVSPTRYFDGKQI